MGVGILRDGFMKKIGYIIIPVALIIILCIWGCMSYDKEKESTVKKIARKKRLNMLLAMIYH